MVKQTRKFISLLWYAPTGLFLILAGQSAIQSDWPWVLPRLFAGAIWCLGAVCMTDASGGEVRRNG